MASKNDFEFLNNEIWLKYTQDRYTPLEDIKYRLEKLGKSQSDWPELKVQIQYFRKMGAIPFFLDSIEKKFWYFPSDSINKKIHQVEALGNRLYDKIENQRTFKNEFLANAAVEEAITSAIYEGANSTRSKAKALIASGKKPKNKDEWMLINNYFAMKWIKENSSLPVSSGVVLKIHEVVSKNTLEGDDANFCGKFRDDVVYVGPHQGILHEKIDAAINEMISLVTDHPRFLHGLIKGILLHYFIAYIHPFFDGNGRTARTLFYFKAIKNELKFVELLSVSANLKEYGKRYEKSFELVKEHELDMTYFIDFCLDSLITSVKKVEQKVNYLIEISNLIESDNLNINQVSLLQKLALNKYREVTIEDYAEEIDKSREIARRELKDLLGKGFLKEERKGKKFIYFVKSKELKERVRKG
ncbi:MAG: hypothetical protein CL678_10710 [Bdellovibrionaceae bacterium]|nr:hypothetical protein [Pseudobdellovibrionaceae bacterium]|tara:strand:- start:66 stop:1310 length:1245 start_codon:yes stop_codon:yes gene_type:complete